jgi:hypothetical protein
MVNSVQLLRLKEVLLHLAIYSGISVVTGSALASTGFL